MRDSYEALPSYIWMALIGIFILLMSAGFQLYSLIHGIHLEPAALILLFVGYTLNAPLIVFNNKLMRG